MIYCIGHRERYDASLTRGRSTRSAAGSGTGPSSRAARSGRRTPTRGPSWPDGNRATREVYGVDADWDSDTLQFRDEPFRRLVKTAAVIRLPREGDPPA
jgi:hypothetical protein